MTAMSKEFKASTVAVGEDGVRGLAVGEKDKRGMEDAAGCLWAGLVLVDQDLSGQCLEAVVEQLNMVAQVAVFLSRVRESHLSKSMKKVVL